MHSTDSDHQLGLLKWSLHGLGGLVALGIVLAAVLIVYRPVARQAVGYLRQSAKLQSLLQSEDRVRAKRSRLQDELATANEQAGKLQSRIPDEPREADFLAQVSRLAQEIGLKLHDYRPGQVTTHPSYSAMRVELICKGDYASLCRFVDGLTKLPRHSTVVRLQITSDGKQKPYAAEISLELYFAAKGRSVAGSEGRSAAGSEGRSAAGSEGRCANSQTREDPHA